MITTDHQIHFRPGPHSNKRIASGPPKRKSPDRVPHVAKLMALAIRLDQLIREGTVADQAELARLGHVTRARLTQIMNLLCIAPDIQEEILFLPPTESGRNSVTERDLRPIAATLSWSEQRRTWRGCCGESATRGNALSKHS